MIYKPEQYSTSITNLSVSTLKDERKKATEIMDTCQDGEKIKKRKLKLHITSLLAVG